MVEDRHRRRCFRAVTASLAATFSLLLALLAAAATAVGLVVLGQDPSAADLIGVGLVITGVALHQERGSETASTG
jgi:inner membrane transporter RhtA